MHRKWMPWAPRQLVSVKAYSSKQLLQLQSRFPDPKFYPFFIFRISSYWITEIRSRITTVVSIQLHKLRKFSGFDGSVSKRLAFEFSHANTVLKWEAFHFHFNSDRFLLKWHIGLGLSNRSLHYTLNGLPWPANRWFAQSSWANLEHPENIGWNQFPDRFYQLLILALFFWHSLDNAPTL